jgi:hypothetical protein
VEEEEDRKRFLGIERQRQRAQNTGRRGHRTSFVVNENVCEDFVKSICGVTGETVNFKGGGGYVHVIWSLLEARVHPETLSRLRFWRSVCFACLACRFVNK